MKLLITTIAAVVLVGCGGAIHQAAKDGNIEAAKQHIAKGADVNAKGWDGRTPLHFAVLRSSKEMAELLIAAGADVNAKSDGGSTPLHGAALRGNEEVAELLIAKGADVNAKDENGTTPLHFADTREIAELLIAKGAEVNAKGGDGSTPLDWAILSNETKTADLLRKHGGKSGAKDSIHIAARMGNLEVTKQHLAAGSDVNTKNDALEWTPLHFAALEGRKEIVELLIAKGADVNAKGKVGLTPLHWAITYNHPELADLLRKHGGKTGEEFKAEGKISDPKQLEPAKEGKKLWAKSYLNKKAPELIVEKWLSEKPEWKGKFLLVDFWATWCGPCLKAIPELNRFHEQFGKQMVVVGLSDEQESKVASMKQPQIEYYSAIDTQKRMKNEVKVTGIPHVMIIDPQGIVRWEGFPFLSGHELTEEVVENLLRKHGGKKGKELKAEGK